MSSNVTLSAATRQNLLSLQDTASLLSTTQSRLSTGKKVNSALDNPVNFFTSQSLNARSSDLTSLLDGISTGIQTIQAANQGITNLQKLTDQLKSVTQQALASSNAFSSKAKVAGTAAVTTDPISQSILGGLTAAQATGTVTYAAANLTSQVTAASTATGTADLNASGAMAALGSITLTSGANTATFTANASATVSDLTTALSTAGFTAAVDGTTGFLTVSRTDGAAITISGSGKTDAGIADAAAGAVTTTGDTLTVNGQTFTAGAGGANGFSSLSTLVSAINNNATIGSAALPANRVAASEQNGQLVLTSGGTTGTITTSGTAQSKLGLAASTAASGSPGLAGQTLSVTVGSGTPRLITFGSNRAAGEVSTLDQLNSALQASNAQASIDSTGRLSITTSNEAGAETLSIQGTAAVTLFGAATSATAVNGTGLAMGGDGQVNRNKLVNDYNNLLTQIDQQAKDASFNGVNLLNGDNLKITFNEKNSSFLVVQGTAISSEGLGLSAIGNDDFKDGVSINAVKENISKAVDMLKSQASTYGSNLSVVQNRQDFTKNLVNILDTGSANLVNADLNEEAANSQALSTRNSLAISALSLANQSQQGILQLLR
ncbi:flagellin [Methylorubrum populi]|uniref:Flagellin n=1 Tax=Methylorubrum populi TaxID=223967 RepID=A0A833J784_9HYPH|nr:flagellin [Methylorubrum populi]KAB7785985.1 Flagellar cap protein FliD [Methylorubrum populi]